MGARSETSGMRFLADNMAVFPFNVETMKEHYNPKHPWEINPNKEYPKCFQEFMTTDGTWDLYGNLHAAFDGMTMIDEKEVQDICDKR